MVLISDPPVAAAGDLEKGKETEENSCFPGTVFSLFFTFPLFLWVCTLIYRIVADAARDYDCGDLLKEVPVHEAAFAIALIMVWFCIYFTVFLVMGNWLAFIGFLLLVVTSFSVIAGFPNLESKSTFGIFHSSPSLSSSSSSSMMVSEYWNSTIRTCVCRTQACEDMVYKKYFIKINDLEDSDSSGYAANYELHLQPKRQISPPAKDANGTSSKNGDKYHEVCYTKKLRYGYEGNTTLCYDCYACEEEFLRRHQRRRWSLGNSLYLHNMLLIATNVIMFLTEAWARYMK